MATTPTLLPANRMARWLHVPVRWLKAEAAAGRIPHLDADGRLLFNPMTVERLLLKRAARGEGEGSRESAVLSR